MVFQRQLMDCLKKLIENDGVAHLLRSALKNKNDSLYSHCVLPEYRNYHQAFSFDAQKEVPGEFNDSDINGQRILNRLSHIGIMYVDKYDVIRYANLFFEDMINRDAGVLIGTNFLDFHRPHRRGIVKKKLLKLKSGEINGWERLMTVKEKYIESKYTRMLDEKGNYDGFLMFAEDVSKREALLRDLKTNIEKNNTLVQANKLLAEVRDLDDILRNLCDMTDKVVHVEHLNVMIRKYRGMNFYNIGENGGFVPQIQEFLSESRALLLQAPLPEVQIKKIEGRPLLLIPLTLKKDNSGCICIELEEEIDIGGKEVELLKIIGSYVNTAIQNHLLFVEIKEKAIRDNLTGIYNRQYFQEVIRTLEAEKRNFTFIMADIDDLKYVNDHMSHMAGDLLIRKAAEIIQQSIRRTDLVFRYGGDEFVILMPDAEQEKVDKIIKRIEMNIAQWKPPQPGLNLSMSVGYAMSSHSGSIKETLSHADKNMYTLKNRRKSERNPANATVYNLSGNLFCGHPDNEVGPPAGGGFNGQGVAMVYRDDKIGK